MIHRWQIFRQRLIIYSRYSPVKYTNTISGLFRCLPTLFTNFVYYYTTAILINFSLIVIDCLHSQVQNRNGKYLWLATRKNLVALPSRAIIGILNFIEKFDIFQTSLHFYSICNYLHFMASSNL